MFNTIEFGNWIAEKRREKGMTQEELVERVGEEYISLSTLKRMESGAGHIDMGRALKTCSVLGCNLSDFLDEKQINSDFRKTVETYFDGDVEEKDIDNVLYRQHLFYPKPVHYCLYQNHAIMNLVQLIIYLPLMEEDLVYEVLRYLEGNVFDREYYVLNKLDYLVRNIPESNAKKYADLQAKRCTYDHYVAFYSGDQSIEEEMYLDPKRSDEILSWYEEYIEIADKKMKRMRLMK